MLTLSGVRKRFGPVQALDGCSFSVERGRTLGFLGPNRAGKTTTMRAIFGLVEPGERLVQDKKLLRGEAQRGAAVLSSSHQFERVEDICEEVAIVDRGRVVATGDFDDLRRLSQRRQIQLQLDSAPPLLPHVAGVECVARHNGDLRLSGHA